MMSLKRIFIVLTVCLTAASCLDDEAVHNVAYEKKAINEVQILEVRQPHEETEIETFYIRNSDCETFFNFDYTVSGNERIIVMITSTVEKEGCKDLNTEASQTLKFRPNQSGTYIFKFWTGDDDAGNPVYLEQEVIIPEKET